MKREFPYLAARLMATVYQREDFDFRIGEPAAEIHARRSIVPHPRPFNAIRSLSEECWTLLATTVSRPVRAGEIWRKL